MSKRKIIKIDAEKCNGCGSCIPACPEGAIQVIDGKARLISDLFCDGLGACLGECPLGAIAIEEREAEPYDERQVIENIAKQGGNVIKAHLEHLRNHGEKEYLKIAIDYLQENGLKNPLDPQDQNQNSKLPCGCPGSKMMDFRDAQEEEPGSSSRQKSSLKHWPIQLMLVPPSAPYLNQADLLIAADCAAFASANFHQDFLRGKSLVIACPKLDDINFYKEKLTEIFRLNDIKSVTVAHMEVPCCFGLGQAVEEALKSAGKAIPVKREIVTIRGEKQ